MPKKETVIIDRWHFPRLTLAQHVLSLFESNLSSALVFFAPRRMGKTEFLRKDVMPLAQEKNWTVFYFSFLDAGEHADNKFVRALLQFIENLSVTHKAQGFAKRLSKVSAEALGIKGALEFHDPIQSQYDVKDLLAYLSEQGPLLLLMDEVQTLAQHVANIDFIASLRTALDIHKDTIKVIFTGSSQVKLRQMFSQANAPFFYFGQNLPFPELDQEFTDHLASIFHDVTQRSIDRQALWIAFEKMRKVPQLVRTLVERLALNLDLTLEAACDQLLTEVYADRTYVKTWEECAILSRLLLKEISIGMDAIFSVPTRTRLAKLLHIDEVTVSSMQSALRQLERKGLIGKVPEKSGEYFIDDPNFKHWLAHKNME